MKTLWYLLILSLAVMRPGHCEDDEANIEIVGLGDNCGGQSVCDSSSHLTCVKLQCHCDTGTNFTLDEAGVSCVLAENSDELFSDEEEDALDEEDPNYHHDDHNESSEEDPHSKDSDTKWPEDEGEWKLPENNTGKGINPEAGNGDAVEDEQNEVDKEDTPPVDQSDKKASNATNDSAVVVDSQKVIPQDQDGQVPADKVDNDSQQKSLPEEPEAQQQKEVKDGPNHDDAEDDLWKGEKDDNDNSWVLAECAQDSDCTSSFGKYSICNLDDQRCECSDTEGKHRKTLLINGTCFVWKELGSDCTSHEECDALISGPAWCHTDKSSATSYCTCRPFHVWDEMEFECLPIATSGVGSPCQNDDQCTPAEALGPFSKCSELTGTCECMPALGPKAKRVLSFQDKCVEERELGEDCETDQQCQASLGSSAHCHPLAQTCSCRPGHFCNKMLVRPAMSGFTLFVLVALCFSVGLGSVLCFVFKRRGGQGEGSYSFIQQQNDV